MKAITIWQPWASLIACGAKKYETRSWPTKYRGAIAIHAALKVLREPALVNGTTVKMPQKALDIFKNASELPRGSIIATAELVDCIKITPELAASMAADELALGDWTPGRYAWELQNVKVLPAPVPIKGKQGLWNW